MRKVRVELPENGYDIVIGEATDDALSAFLRDAPFSSRAMILSDTNVAKLYGERFTELFRASGRQAALHVVPAGESSKSLAEAERAYTRAVEYGLDRRSVVVALGGGVVGDLAGFVAATYMRGVPFLQIPTSLLAQVDSSVGGKVAVNHSLGKNLIGAFYQPKGVFIDLGCLSTLPRREVCTGLGEIVKYGVIYDGDFFAYLEEHSEDVLALAPEAAEHIIVRSCEIKAEVVGEDERETGLRAILNFGHTMGHAIEKETHYVRYNHGEAVAIGMAGAAYLSRELGMVGDREVERLLACLRRFRLPTVAEGCTEDGMYAAIFHDKKAVDGKVKWILMEGIGRVRAVSEVPEASVRKCMRMILAG
ncbi:MAG: 3-dehydroquinate synthase [Schwartzia sp.]|nr:3-dehydroquinate synthase [Schwartzia sp. (in: firmicutes)]